MTKISRDAAKALLTVKDFKRDNTQVIVWRIYPDTSSLYLHGNCIAIYHSNTKLLDVSLAGFPTLTTKSRLNAILNHFYSRVYTNDFTTYLQVGTTITEMPVDKFMSIDLNTHTIKHIYSLRESRLRDLL